MCWFQYTRLKYYSQDKYNAKIHFCENIKFHYSTVDMQCCKTCERQYMEIEKFVTVFRTMRNTTEH